MTKEEFAEVTRSVIGEDGLDEFEPTVCYPRMGRVAVLTGIPFTLNQKEAAIEMAQRGVEKGEVWLLAIRHSASQFEIISFDGVGFSTQVFDLI